VVKEPED